MTKEMIGLIVGTVVILLSFVFVCGTFLYLYLRDQKLVRLAQSSVQGTVVGYSRFREGYLPIVEYTVDGLTYKKTLQYFMIKTVTTPWGPTKVSNDYTREEMLAPSITRYSNSFVSFDSLMKTHFPSLGSTGLGMTQTSRPGPMSNVIAGWTNFTSGSVSDLEWP